MDRRNFLSQSFVTMGTYAVSFSTFATSNLGGFANVSLRSGSISQKEFEAAAHEASVSRRLLVLHPQSKVKISSDLTVDCSIAGNGGTIEISKGSKLIFKGGADSFIKTTGVNFNGEVVYTHDGEVNISENKFINNHGDALVLEKNSSFKVSKNTIVAQSHGIVILSSNKGSISSNKIEVKGDDGQFVWAENSFNLEVVDNTFSNKTKNNPTVGIANDHDLNPNLTLRNNRIA